MTDGRLIVHLQKQSTTGVIALKSPGMCAQTTTCYQGRPEYNNVWFIHDTKQGQIVVTVYWAIETELRMNLVYTYIYFTGLVWWLLMGSHHKEASIFQAVLNKEQLIFEVQTMQVLLHRVAVEMRIPMGIPMGMGWGGDGAKNHGSFRLCSPILARILRIRFASKSPHGCFRTRRSWLWWLFWGPTSSRHLSG